ncbi:hypothetical protein L210DRAFT_1028793 [Boletus edulis BED1]|uniref:T6SS Phospholipase effector Tle1-like catalytic domain-containing protein n=1 Tax=Boletus edulis BED1 TaxID=1328754 RepID=A0AAD4C0G1_BOLED|nr:hypothetical protein L210DRAFT_1028793 [Boletus edulis BED1]
MRCVQRQESARNLVVCIDDTSDQYGPNNTNVVKLFAKIDLESTQPEQFAYYSSVVGTRSESLHPLGRMQRAVYDKFDVAAARNMEENVKDAYGWLAQIYREGDQIYLFGFSRGAYQVRVLAGVIHEVGLAKGVTTEDQTGKAYCCYEAIRQGKPKAMQTAREFKKTSCWQDVRVHFVGVWDTIGPMKGDVLLPVSSSAAHTCHFRHALALDELRVKFMPEYFHEMNSLRNLSTYRREIIDAKEVWFAGSHSDMWFRNAGHVSLLWMRREATANGLVLKPADVVWLPDDLDSGVTNSMTSIWRPFEYLPIKHQVSFSGTGEDARR